MFYSSHHIYPYKPLRASNKILALFVFIFSHFKDGSISKIASLESSDIDLGRLDDNLSNNEKRSTILKCITKITCYREKRNILIATIEDIYGRSTALRIDSWKLTYEEYSMSIVTK